MQKTTKLHFVRVKVIERVPADREFFPFDLRLACGHTKRDVGGPRHRIVVCQSCTDTANEECFCGGRRYEHHDADVKGCAHCKRLGTDAETYRHVFDPAD